MNGRLRRYAAQEQRQGKGMETRITARARAQRLPRENGKALKPNVTGHPNELSGHRKAARRRRRDSIARRPRLRKNQPTSHACVPVSNITVTGQSWIWQSRDATADTRYERRQQYTIPYDILPPRRRRPFLSIIRLPVDGRWQAEDKVTPGGIHRSPVCSGGPERRKEKKRRGC